MSIQKLSAMWAFSSLVKLHSGDALCDGKEAYVFDRSNKKKTNHFSGRTNEKKNNRIICNHIEFAVRQVSSRYYVLNSKQHISLNKSFQFDLF